MNKKLIDKVNELRKIKNNLNFLQIGAYDGISMKDPANIILNENDIGIFIEPNPYILNELKYNKINYKNSIILPFAIIPDNEFYHEFFHIHKNGGGSSFIRGMINKNIIESDEFTLLDIKIITVLELFKKYINYDIDILFTDCEGYDFDINKKILELCKPKIIYMEAWNTIDLKRFTNQITTRDEMIEFLNNNGYDTIFEKIDENLICILR